MEKYKSKLKSELAQAAGVSLPTFRRWLLSDQEALRQMGVSPSTKILPPVAVRYLCEKYCIDIDWATQNEKKKEKVRKEQKGEERNRTPFLFFVVILSSETVIHD